MGLIRVLLALAVASAHWALPLPFLNIVPFNGYGAFAVATFFIFSGFYMHMILDKKIMTKVNFYKSRVLRIYPSYVLTIFILFFLTIVTETISFGTFVLTIDSARLTWFDLTPLDKSLVIVSNFTSIGSDLIHFSHFSDLHLFPPAWTLSVEFLFYLFCPFLVKFTNKSLIFILFLSLLVRVGTFLIGFQDYIWRHLFFPSELCFFVLGMLAYRFHIKILKIHLNSVLLAPPPQFNYGARNFTGFNNYLNQVKPQILWATVLKMIGLLLLTTFIISYALNIIPTNEISLLFFAVLVAFASPFIFSTFENLKWDRFLGDFSYILYLTHFSAIKLSLLLFNSINYSYIVLILLSIIIYFLFERKVRLIGRRIRDLNP